ncbi:hypothetical protein [Anaerovibrio sp. RM50]|uniref:DUF3846 domain-containing protein n=1 Tax=Anaerovibrio sp. RM50 TaxID=1200557 RepID=UPI00048A08BE|nr:hypothetical protein [Anaerovibrio sp. RM50]
MKIKVFVLDHKNHYCREVVEIDEEDSLHEMYRVLHCELVDVQSFDIDGVEYDIWFDEEFLLKGEPLACTFVLGELKKGRCIPICGSWMIAKHDEEGRTIGLTDEDIDKLWTYTDENSIKASIACAKKLFV